MYKIHPTVQALIRQISTHIYIEHIKTAFLHNLGEMVQIIYKSFNISRPVFFSITIFYSMSISYVYKKLKSAENKYRVA
jgi:hypothetical protein